MRALIAFLSLVLGLWLFHGDWLILGALSLFWLTFLFWRFSKNGLWIGLIFLSLGAGIGAIKFPLKQNQEVFHGFVVDAKENYFLLKTGLRKYYVYEKNSPRETGDFLTIEGTASNLQFVVLESQFDFGKYLDDQGVVGQIFPRTIQTDFEMPIRTKAVQQEFLSHFEPNARGFLAGLLFGEADDRNQATEELGNLQVNFLISISGIHMSFWLQVTTFLFSLKIKDKWAKLLALGSLFPLALFSITKISVVRVLGLFLLKWLNEHRWKKRFSSLTLICALGVICCLISRYIVYSLSFALTFSVPIFLILSNNGLQNFPKKARNMVFPLFLFLFLLPINAFTRFEIHFLGVASQFVLSPVILVLFLLGTVSFYSLPFVWPLNFLSSLLVQIVRFFSSIDANLILGQPSIFFVIFYYFFLLGFLIGIESKHKKKVLLCLSLMALTISIQGFPLKNTLTNSVSFINVGQGDSILIREQNTTVLIDTGGSLYYDVSKDILMPYFKKQKITHIDYLITTHDDYDHSGGAETLMNRFEVKNYITEKEAFPLIVGSLVLKNLNTFEESQTDENINSLVLSFEFLQKTWLFMGDAPVEVEKKILETYPHLKSDVLKVGHHGSETSTSFEFLKRVLPSTAIISVGRNTFGHPSSVVLERLAKAGAQIRRTDTEGTITYTEWVF